MTLNTPVHEMMLDMVAWQQEGNLTALWLEHPTWILDGSKDLIPT